MFGYASERSRCITKVERNRYLGETIGMNGTVPRKNRKYKGPRHKDVTIRYSGFRQTGRPHSSILNKSSTSAVAGLLRGLNKPVPFANPRELGIRLLVEYGPLEIRDAADE